MTTNLPNGDIWNLKNRDINSQWYEKLFKFDFSFIEAIEIKNFFKQYIWSNYVQQNITINKLYSDVYNFRHFNAFSKKYDIDNLVYIENNTVSAFITYLHTNISENIKKPLSYHSQKKVLDTLKAVIHWGQLYLPNSVPKVEIFVGSEYKDVNKHLKIDFIPDYIVKKINEALKCEENPYMKFGIIILQSTGMRVGDMVSLTIHCIKPHLISGYTLIWYDHKNRVERQPMPITPECALAINKLIEYTSEIRKLANDKIKNYLFLYKVTNSNQIYKKNDITNLSLTSFCVMLKQFIKIHDIKDNNGNLYNLSSHKFRRTLGTDIYTKISDINIVRDVLGISVNTAKRYYADIKDKERAETFVSIGVIGNIDMVDKTIIPDKRELKWFVENKDKSARMIDGYCTSPCNDGKICDRLLKRQKCYSCSRYLTSPEFLYVHKSYLLELQQKVKDNIYGEHYIEHFIPVIEVLKNIISKLEELTNEAK